MEDRLNEALVLAALCHDGQRDKGGVSYILHPLRVMLAVKGEDARVVAVLHDAVEDAGLELGTVRRLFGGRIEAAVDAISRRNGEDYSDFILRCAANPLAREVKLADLADNMDVRRLGREPTASDAKRLEKYNRARAVLLAASSRTA